MSELSPETRALLARGSRGTAPGPERRAAMRRQILAKAAAGAVVTTSATAAAWTTAAKVVGVASVLVATGVGAKVVATRVERAEVTHPMTTTTTTVASAPRIVPAIVPAIVTNVPAPSPEPVALPPVVVEPSPVPRTPPPARVFVAAPAPAPVPAAPLPSIASTSIESAPVRDDAPPEPRVRSSAPVKVGHSLEEEARLLRDAHAALAAGDGARALRLLDEHASRFPSSGLEPERSAERVFAFCATGNTSAARASAASFLGAHATGPLATRVKSSCGGRIP